MELNQSLVTGSIQAAQLEGEVIKIHFREKKKLGFLQDLAQSKAVIFQTRKASEPSALKGIQGILLQEGLGQRST